MKPVLQNVLSVRNSHPRDANIQFFEEGHKYTILTEPNVKYTSVTTWNHSHFEKFDADKIIENMMKGKGWKEGHKYWGLTAEQIKAQWNSNKDAVSGAGTDLHFEIECFQNDKRFQFAYTNKELYEVYMTDNKESHDFKPIEWQYFINFVRDFPELKPFRTEWLIYDDDVKISGSIDMVYENPDGTLSIYDWKRCMSIEKTSGWNKYGIVDCINHLPDTNFWHYSLQLNIYKGILEKNYGVEISQLFLVKLHPDNKSGSFELIKLPFLKDEILSLFEVLKTRPLHVKTN